jgi:hypothetical protein
MKIIWDISPCTLVGVDLSLVGAWKRYAPPKRWSASRLHGEISWKIHLPSPFQVELTLAV